MTWLPGVLMWAGGLAVTKVSTVGNVFPFIVHLGGAPLQAQIIGHIGTAAVAKILTNIDQNYLQFTTENITFKPK